MFLNFPAQSLVTSDGRRAKTASELNVTVKVAMQKMTSSVSVGISEEEEDDQEINVDSAGEEMEEDFDIDEDEDVDDRLRGRPHSSGGEDFDRDSEKGTDRDCGEDSNDSRTAVKSSSVCLPFSISRLLGHSDVKHTPKLVDHGDITSLYSHPSSMAYFSKAVSPPTSDSLIFTAGNGVIRVPAHRPSNVGANPAIHNPGLASPFPWLAAAAAMDPSIMHRSAAVAAFANHVVKERLSGKIHKFILLYYK